MRQVGVIGASGYVGQQLIWFLNNSKYVNVRFMATYNYANQGFSEIYNSYYGFIEGKCISIQDAEDRLEEIEVVFLALPHGKSFHIVQKALEKGVKVIDLGADFRFDSYETYEKWYGVKHEAYNLLEDAVYGLSEINREKIKKANLVGNPGCYTTASILALYPILKSGIIDSKSIIIDGKSGVSGVGKAMNISSLFVECNESIKAYGVASHRHTPEIEQELSKASGKDVNLVFTPHLIPMNRGIMCTCYGKLKGNASQEKLYQIYNDLYGKEKFIRVIEKIPETKNVRGSNLCDIAIRVDKRTNTVIVISVIDNLIKGAAGQAIQNMNLMLGLREEEGIEILPVQI